MARGKKKGSALTPEEKLVQALVPMEEQPYKVPKNWCWTKAGNMVTLYRGVSYKKNDAHTEKGENDCLIMRGGNISEGGIDTEADNVYVNKDLVTQEQLVKKHDIIIVSSTGSTKVIGRAGISLMDYDDVAFGAFLTLLRPVDYVSKSFVDYYFQSDLYRERIRSLASGVNINNIRTEYITESPVPLPPLAEQQRIVDRIEYLFAKLGEAKEKAQSVLDSFETRKAAILHKAFTGELTAKWRAAHGGRFDAWRTLSVSDIGDVITGSTPDTKKPEYYGGEVPFVKPTELNQGRYVEAAADTLTEAGRGVSRPVRAGSTCVCCIGATISKCGFLMIDAVTNQQINTIVPYSFMDDAFVYYYCISNRFKNSLIDNSSSTTLPIINKKKMSALEFVAPPKEEQTEIVRILDSLFAKEQQAKEAAETVQEKIDLLKKSILARAFRGELGTNDPTEQSVLELLKSIL